MQAVFKSRLDDTEVENIRKFCNSVEYCSIEQTIGWAEMCYNTNICYFILTDNSEIKSFSLIYQHYRFAHIDFGPVCCNKELMITSINEIINFYKKKGFYSLDIQMYYKTGYDTDYIEYALNKIHDIKYIFNSDHTKSSIEIDLTHSLDEIYSNIRKGHKSDIKRASKLGLTVDYVKNKSELDSFFQIYSKMCQARNIDEGELTLNNIDKIFDFLSENKKGKILIVKDKDNIILGGAIFVYQGISVRYYKSASDPDKRDYPISHLVLYEAIKEARNEGFRYFDFWGYNHFVDKNDQVFYINHFKKGFGGYYTFFAKRMNINIIPYGYDLYRSLLLLKNMFRKITLN
jgi:lipid II:glycine glycyltransferase (peptidoglycan interpeptide bridge formation enzyme)